jgi:hypothetical protein
MQGTKKLRDVIESEDFIAAQKRLCEEYRVDFKKVEELNSMIEPLLQNLMGEALMIVNEKFADINRNAKYWMEVFRLSASLGTIMTPKQKSLLELYSYLVLSEGVFSETIQVIAFILMENHHDIYDVENMKFVKNYEGLNNVSLFEKMQFVEMHGFKFVSDACDRNLRNSIAHLRIMVNEDGSIMEMTPKGKTRKINMKEKSDYLGCISAVTLRAVHGLLGKLLGSRKLRKI